LPLGWRSSLALPSRRRCSGVDVDEFLRYAIPGIPVGCVYALVAVSLVLTYTTSGVFNLAFGAQAYVSAVVFYLTVVDHGWPKLPAFLVAVVVIGPLLGLLLDRGLFRWMRTAPMTVKLVSALGLLVGVPPLVNFLFGTATRLGPPSVAPDPEKLVWARYGIVQHQAITVAITVAVVIVLAAMLRFTTLGLRMRAVVESPRMVQLAGINADRVSLFAWMLSSFLVGLAGVLLAPLFANVADTNFTVLLVSAIAAGAVGRLRSIPWTLAGGVLLGVGQNVLSGYLPAGSILSVGLRPAFPFIVLVLLLLFLPGLRTRREAVDPLSVCDPPPPALAATYRDASLDRMTRIAFPAFVVAFMVVALFVVSSYWLFLLTQGIVFTIIFLSITVLTGMSGQLSLCQAAFAGVGAFTAGQLASQQGVSVLLGMVIGGAVAALVGVVVALPALRLSGLYLALATLAFGLLADNVVFPLSWVGRGNAGVSVPRPTLGSIDFTSTRSFFLLSMAVFAVCAFVVILVRKGTTGQQLAALRGSDVAAQAIGINPVRAKITVFALSAAIAGVGGALYGSLQLRVSGGDFNFFFSLVFVVLVLTTGARTVEGAVNAGMAFVLFREVLQTLQRNDNAMLWIAVGAAVLAVNAYVRHHEPRKALKEAVTAVGAFAWWLLGDGTPSLVGLQYALFGFGAVSYAKHPEGIVEWRKRESLQALMRGRNGAPTDFSADSALSGPIPAQSSVREALR
jgi:ABC-type branched-subunit amino acid transport system permease subunit